SPRYKFRHFPRSDPPVLASRGSSLKLTPVASPCPAAALPPLFMKAPRLARRGPSLPADANPGATAYRSFARPERPRAAICERGRAPLFLLRGALRASCRGATVTVSFRLRMGLRAARNPLPMGILLDYRIACLVHFLVDRHFAGT